MQISELKHGSSTVVFALDVLETISEKGEAGLKEIATLLKADKGRVVRVLRSLSLRGYVTQNEQTKKYRLGFRVSALAEIHRRNSKLEVIARPFLKRVRDLFGGTAILRLLEDGRVITAASEESSSTLKVSHRIGSRFPLARGAHGKVLAAYMPDAEIRRILRAQGIPRYTRKTIVDIEKYLRHLKRVRDLEFGFDDEEVEQGVRSLAAPVRDSSGKVIASIGVSAPSFLIPISSVSSVGGAIKKIAAELSSELGYEKKHAR